ncbi:hypothetical protein [uncultured Marinobacter sp.]|uniref:hypothetical protein n=1 Tax=uncultured Marinobacter sp. TaxID=187379 RepID=UPI0030D9353F
MSAAYDLWKTTDTEYDEAQARQEQLEAAQRELANDLFDGYFTRNGAVIDEVSDLLEGTDWQDRMIDDLRNAFMTGSPLVFRLAYQRIMIDAVNEIARKCKDLDAINTMRKDLEL